MEERRRWTSMNADLKQYVLEKFQTLLRKRISINKTNIKLIDDNGKKEESSFSRKIQLYPVMLGGYTYEYIYGVDTLAENSLFSATEDVDIRVNIPDIFSTEEMIIDIKSLSDPMSIFNILISNVLQYLSIQDYSDSPELDELPEVTEELSFNCGKLRFKLAESQFTTMAFQKLQILCSRNGMLHEICDLMFTMEKDYKFFDFRTTEREFYNGTIGEINYPTYSNLLSSELSALYERYKYNSSLIKTRNHIGRIYYLSNYVLNNECDIIKRQCVIEFNRFIFSLQSDIRAKTLNDKIKNIRYIVLCEYNGTKITVEDLLSVIKDYALSVNDSRFIIMFNQ